MDLKKLEEISDFLSKKYFFTVKKRNKLTLEEMIQDIINHYEDIIYSMPGNVYWFDRNLITVGCNKNVLDLFGLKYLSDFKGLSFDDQAKICNWTDSVKNSFLGDTKEVIETGEPKLNVEEPPIQDKNGKMLHFLTSRVPLFDREKNVIGVLGISIDVTKEKMAEMNFLEQVKKTESAYLENSQFMSIASHEIRGPLSNSILILNAIKAGMKASKIPEVIPVSRISDAIVESSEAIKSLDYLVHYLSLERTGLKVSVEKCNIEDFLNNVTSYDEKKIGKKINFKLNYSGFLSKEVMFDHYHAEEILSIIIKNSIKFSKENGLITLSAEANEKNLIFTVKDNGVGISKEHLDNILVPIFSDFKNAENRFKKPSIKLSYVKKILEYLDGQLLIDSKVNEWTEAKIILPFSYADNKKLKSEKEIVNKKEKLNILLVDDNPLTLYLHKEQLGKYTNIIDTAESGLKSIEMCKKNKYDVVFMDITMPDINGIEAMKKIRNVYKNDDKTLFVAVTSHASEDDIYFFNENGFIAVLTKPVNADDFEECIKAIIKIIEEMS